MSETERDGTTQDAAALARLRRRRSIAIGLALGIVVILFYTATIVRLGPNALRKEVPPNVGVKQKVVVPPGPAGADCKRLGTC